MNTIEIRRFKVLRGNKCEICDSSEQLCIDHCHKTQAVRGLLCRTCNQAVSKYDNFKEQFLKYVTIIEDTIKKNPSLF